MKRDQIQPTIGSWAAGKDFYDREIEVEQICSMLRSGQSLSIAAPRRVGKTSIMREVVRLLNSEAGEEKTRIRGVFIDVEAARSPEEVISEIAAACQGQASLTSVVKDWGKKLLGGTELDLQFAKVDLSKALASDWQTRGSRLLAEICAVGDGVVLVLDELPVFLAGLLRQGSASQGRTDADIFLSWLRRQTQDHVQRLRIVVMGSIGLGPLLAEAGLSATLNTLRPYQVGPWDEETTVGALHALSRSQAVTLSDAGATKAVALLGLGVPFHVQLLHAELVVDARRRRSTEIGPTDVERVWTGLVRNPSYDLPHWEQRLRHILPPAELAAACALLTATSIAEPLTASQAVALVRPHVPDLPEEVTRRLLRLLVHDGYLAEGPDGWYFPFRLLRAWWAAQYAPFQGTAR